MNDQLKVVLQKNSDIKTNKKIAEITNKIKQIEQLSHDFEALKQKIASLKQQVDSQSQTHKNDFCKTKEAYILLLVKKHSLKSLTKWQKGIIADMINKQAEILADFDYCSPELEEAYTEFSKAMNAEMNSFEKEMANDYFNQMMSEMGFDPEDDDFDFNFENMNDPGYKKKMEEKFKQHAEESHQKQKEIEKEMRVAKTDIDFQKVYKKLAKITHPDLSKSEEERITKEAVMQRLTKAWDSRDYYELLMIWLEIDPENTIDLEITENNQKNIIRQLNEKLEAINQDIYDVKNNYNDTAFYFHNFDAKTQKSTDKKIKKFIADLTETTNDTAQKILMFNKTITLKKHLTMVYDMEKNFSLNDFMNSFR